MAQGQETDVTGRNYQRIKIWSFQIICPLSARLLIKFLYKNQIILKKTINKQSWDGSELIRFYKQIHASFTYFKVWQPGKKQNKQKRIKVLHASLVDIFKETLFYTFLVSHILSPSWRLYRNKLIFYKARINTKYVY